jgi:hypothetical protein
VEDTVPLAARLLPPHERRQEQPARHPRRRDPEDRELQVPGAEQAVGQQGCDVEAVEGPRLDAVVGERAAGQGLEQEESRDDSEELAGGALAGRQSPAAERAVVEVGRRRLALPAQVVELAEEEEDGADSSQERDQAQGAPEIG